jgi:hypothetical protein
MFGILLTAVIKKKFLLKFCSRKYTPLRNPPAELLARAEAWPVNADLVEFKPKGHYVCYDQTAKSRDAFGLLVVASLTMKIAEGGCGKKNCPRNPR